MKSVNIFLGAAILTGAHAAQGAQLSVAALDNYGQHFEHPGWEPILAGH